MQIITSGYEIDAQGSTAGITSATFAINSSESFTLRSGSSVFESNVSFTGPSGSTSSYFSLFSNSLSLGSNNQIALTGPTFSISASEISFSGTSSVSLTGSTFSIGTSHILATNYRTLSLSGGTGSTFSIGATAITLTSPNTTLAGTNVVFNNTTNVTFNNSNTTIYGTQLSIQSTTTSIDSTSTYFLGGGKYNALFSASGTRLQRGNSTPPGTSTAILHISAGGTGGKTAQLKFDAGSLLNTPEDGAMEYEGRILYFTAAGNRMNIMLGLSGSNSPAVKNPASFTEFYGATSTGRALGEPDRWIEIEIEGERLLIPGFYIQP